MYIAHVTGHFLLGSLSHGTVLV